MKTDQELKLEKELAQLKKSHLNLKVFLADVESVKQGVEKERDEWKEMATVLASSLEINIREHGQVMGCEELELKKFEALLNEPKSNQDRNRDTDSNQKKNAKDEPAARGAVKDEAGKRT